MLAVAVTPDGKTLVSAGKDTLIRVWDLPAGRIRLVLRGHARQVNALAVTGDGKTLASAGADQTVRLWDLETGQQRATLAGHTQPLRAVAFSPDDRALASAAGDGPGEVSSAGVPARSS